MEKNQIGKIEVYNKRILSNTGKNLYLINWYRMANFGIEYIYADSEEDALSKFLYTLNKNVTLLVTKLDKNNMPIIRMGTENESLRE